MDTTKIGRCPHQRVTRTIALAFGDIGNVDDPLAVEEPQLPAARTLRPLS